MSQTTSPTSQSLGWKRTPLPQTTMVPIEGRRGRLDRCPEAHRLDDGAARCGCFARGESEVCCVTFAYKRQVQLQKPESQHFERATTAACATCAKGTYPGPMGFETRGDQPCFDCNRPSCPVLADSSEDLQCDSVHYRVGRDSGY